MLKNIKCLQYYLDAKTYNSSKIQQKIEETKKEFPKRKIDVEVNLNEYGVYIITFYIEKQNSKKNRNKIHKTYCKDNYNPVNPEIYNTNKIYGDWSKAKKYKKYMSQKKYPFETFLM